MNEVKHFTKAPEIQHFAEVKTGPNDNVYGVTWANLVREYLKTAYSGGSSQAEVVSFGKTYKVLKRTDVTVFYDQDGNTLFDVTNERLEDEYAFLQKAESENNDEEKPTEENTKKSSVYIGVVGAVTKLRKELKKAKEKDFAEPVIEYLTERCKESESLAADICQDHKTWEKCYKYIYEAARKKLSGKPGPVKSDVVFEWAEDYFRLDDKAEEERKAKEAAERKKKQKEKAKKAKSKPEKAETPKPKEEPKPKKNSKDMDGQLDMFSMMGM